MTFIEESIAHTVASVSQDLDVDGLRSVVRGPVVAPGEPGYAGASRIWNGAYHGREPALEAGGQVSRQTSEALGRQARAVKHTNSGPRPRL